MSDSDRNPQLHPYVQAMQAAITEHDAELIAAFQPSAYLANQLFGNPDSQQSSDLTIQRVELSAIQKRRETIDSRMQPDQSLLDWCAANNWSDPHWVDETGNACWWGFEGADIMPKPIPYRAVAVVSVSGRDQVGTGGDRALNRAALFRWFFEFQHEYERRNCDRSFYRRSNFAEFLGALIDVLLPDRGIRIRMDCHYDNLRYRLELRFWQLERVSISINQRPPENYPITASVLSIGLETVDRLLHVSDVELFAGLLNWALEVLRSLSLQPHSRWLVGTTEQSNRGFASEYNIALQEINQRNANIPGSCQCHWCQQRWQHFT